MTPAIKKLIEDIDQLATWLHDNPNTAMPSQHKRKAQVVLQKIIDAEALSEQEWERLKPEIYRPNPPKQNAKSVKRNAQKKLNTSKKRKKRKKSFQPRAHIVRGGLPSLGKR